MSKVPETEQTIEQIAAEFPTWRFWMSRDTGGKPGELMATRRRPLTKAERRAGLAITLPMGYKGDLRTQLADQVRREELIGYEPEGDAS